MSLTVPKSPAAPRLLPATTYTQEREMMMDTTEMLVSVTRTRFRNVTHTGKRISKLCWLGSGGPLTLPNHNATEYFVTGTWGEDTGNEICLWKLSIDQQNDSYERVALIDKICPFPVIGNVSDTVALGDDKFAFTTSKGVLAIFKVLEDCTDEGIYFASAIHPACASQLHSFKKTKTQCPATGIATNNESVVTVGEDGSIHEISLDGFAVTKSLDSVDQFSITTVKYIGQNEIMTGNSAGQVKLYDLRSNSNASVLSLYDTNEFSGIKSLGQHPSQNHILLIGYESGQLEFQDLRQASNGMGGVPVAYLSHQHSGISEIEFHRLNPENFFTCSQSGELLHWFRGEPSDELNGQCNNLGPSISNDLNLEFLTSKVLHSSPFALNSFSISNHNRLICGGDSGMAFCTELTQI